MSLVCTLKPYTLAAHARDPELRLALLESAGELACRPDAAAALAGGGAAALARAALLPPLAWRAGKAAAAVRFAALAALGALLRRRLLSQVQTGRAAGLSRLLHVAAVVSNNVLTFHSTRASCLLQPTSTQCAGLWVLPCEPEANLVDSVLAACATMDVSYYRSS